MKRNKKFYKMFCLSVLAFTLLTYNSAIAAPTATAVKTTTTKTAPAQTTVAESYITVSPLDVVNNPAKYLNKNISFSADFVAYTSLGLDYKPAFRDGSKYIGILIKRDDVKNHTIPLSEMKIFVPRETAEKHVDLETGDKIKLSGKVFSNALGDPWVDVKTFSVLTEKKKDKIEK